MAGARSDRIGRHFGGRYTVEARLGSGRGGEVFAARDERTGTRVALKVRDESLPSGLDLERSGLRSVEHPHLLRILDAGLDQGSAFVVTELLEGGALSQLQRPLSAALLDALASQMLEALAFLHAQGILHGDVKPENILVAALDPPRFVLADFGLAQRSVDVVAGTTRGSPAFMPPEMIRGEPPDERSDLYSLGITLYESAFAELPFDDADVRTVLMRHLTEAPRRLSSPGDVSPRLVALLKRLLAKEPAARPVDARAALAAWKGEEAAIPRWVPPRLGVLIGREAELAQLESALASPETAVVCVEGPSGIGKTRLLREVALRAEFRGVTVLWWTPDGIRTPDGEWRHADGSVLIHESGSTGTTTQQAEAHARELMALAGDAPALLVLDDFDQAPSWFRDATGFLVREATVQTTANRLVCLLGCQHVVEFTNEALAAGGLRASLQVQISAWKPEDIASAAGALLGAKNIHRNLLDLLVETTSGIPAEVETLCPILPERGLLLPAPDGTLTIAAAVSKNDLVGAASRRTDDLLKRCSPVQLEVLQALALVESPVPPSFLDSVQNGYSAEVPLLHRLGALAFSHSGTYIACAGSALAHQVIDALDASEIRLLHDRIAQAISPLDDESRLSHLIKGSNFPRAREALQQLKAQSSRWARHRLPAPLFESLLTIWPPEVDPADRLHVELELFDILLETGEYEEVLRRVSDARERSQASHGELAIRAAQALIALGRLQEASTRLGEVDDGYHRATLLRAHVLRTQDRHAEAYDLSKSVRSHLAKNDGLWVEATELMAACLQEQGEISEANALLVENLGVCSRSTDRRAYASALATLGINEFYQSRMQDAEVHFLEALSLYSQFGDRFGMTRALNTLAATAAETGRVAEALERWSSAVDLSRRLGETTNLGYMLQNLGHLLFTLARYKESLDLIHEALSIMDRKGLQETFVQTRMALANVYCGVGELRKSLTILEELIEVVRGRPYEAHLLLIRSSVHLQLGSLEGIPESLRKTRALLERVGAEDELVTCILQESRSALQLGDEHLAISLAALAMTETRRLGLGGIEVDAGTWLSEVLCSSDPESAHGLALSTAELAEKGQRREALWRLDRVLARVARGRGDFVAMVEHYNRGLQRIQEISLDVPEESLSAYLSLADVKTFFAELQDIGRPALS